MQVDVGLEVDGAGQVIATGYQYPTTASSEAGLNGGGKSLGVIGTTIAYRAIAADIEVYVWKAGDGGLAADRIGHGPIVGLARTA